MTPKIDTAMVLAAGLGRRMAPLTDKLPKPLVPLAGRALIDHVLDRLAAAGIAKAVINVHHLADQIERHVAGRTSPAIAISDERGVLLETGGGVVRALPQLGAKPFVIHNSDSVWIEHGASNIAHMMAQFNEASMDCLMLLAPRDTSLGYDGRGDFLFHSDGRLERVVRGHDAPFVFAGVSIAHPRLFDGLKEERFSLNGPWDRAIQSGRLFGAILDGTWMHVGTVAAAEAAERLITESRPLRAHS
jgi:N-acetyl-alpha-D-muramate 1-phosphate uridylyltransferase